MHLGFWALIYSLLDVDCIAPPLDLLGSLANLDDIPCTWTPVSLLLCLEALLTVLPSILYTISALTFFNNDGAL